MSEARKCDRCSSYFEYDENMNNYIVFGNRHIIVDLKRGKDFDICELTEHGSSVYGSWLTDKGIALKSALNEYFANKEEE